MSGEYSGHPPFSVKRAAKLKAKKHRDSERLFLAEGKSIIREAKHAPVHVFEGPDEIKRVSSLTTSTSPVGVFRFLDVTPDELLTGGDEGGTGESGRVRDSRAAPRRGTNPVIVLLHGVQDPGNVGTAIRSAHAFGAGVALSAGCADLYNPKTVRGTMGAIFHVPISREVNSAEFLEESRRHGFASVAAMPAAGESPRSLPGGKLLIVVGSEGAGLPGGVVEACDGRVTIPSEAESLNAAVAASILFYEAYSRVLT